MVMNGYELWVCMPLATYNVGFVRSKWIVLFPPLCFCIVCRCECRLYVFEIEMLGLTSYLGTSFGFIVLQL